MPHDDVVRLSATELAAQVREGRLTARAVVDAHIRRIEAVNAQLNALVIDQFDAARAQADAADAAAARGEPTGPLHGVPITIKEQYRVAGTDATLGLPHRVGKHDRDEGPLVTRLREAGALVLGKTNVLQLLAGWESDNPVYGRSTNPWDETRTPGGSSGGDGAIVAARGAALALAGDLGGSIRIPSHFNGVCGFKPTSGRLTNDDMVRGVLAGGQETIISQPGPIARSVADLALAMKILAAPFEKLPSDLPPPVPWRDPTDVDVTGLTIGYCTDNGYFSASPAIRRATSEAAAAMRARGCSVVPFELPDAGEAVRIFLAVFTADGGAGFKRALSGDRAHRLLAPLLQGAAAPAPMRTLIAKLSEARGQHHFARIARNIGKRNAREMFELVEARTEYCRQVADAMHKSGIDALLLPPYALPAPHHGATEHLVAAASYSMAFNVTGMPAGVVPVTRVRAGEESDRADSRDRADRTAREVEQGSAGLPIGVQVVARHWRDDVALAVMAALEADLRGNADYPGAPPL